MSNYEPRKDKNMSDLDQGTIEEPKVPTTEEQQTVELPTTENTAEESDQTLPDGVSERTKEEFEKLKKHNAELKSQLDQIKGSNRPDKTSVLDEIHPQVEVASDTRDEKLNLVDENGYIDIDLLNKTLLESKRQTEEVRREAELAKQQIARFQETEKMKKIHNQFPQLDPYNVEKFDKRFYDFVKNELLGQMMEGKEDVEAAALKASDFFNPKKDEIKEEKKQAIASREQVNTPKGASTGSSSPVDHDDLVRGTYKGDANAIFKRLQASGN